YFLYVVYVLAFTVAFMAVLGAIGTAAAFGALAMGMDIKTPSEAFTAIITVITVIGYVVYLLGVSTIYQVALKFRLWKASAQSVTVTKLAVLDNVRANDAESSAVGEGLADALVGAGAI